MRDAKDFSKAKAEEYKISEKASNLADKTKTAATGAVNYTKESYNSVNNHYQNGTLGEAAQKKAQATGQYVKESSNKLYQKVAQASSSDSTHPN